MNISIQASIKSLLNKEVATALAIATKNPAIIPLMLTVSDDVSIKFSNYADSLIKTDIKTNVGKLATDKGLFSNLNTVTNNISSVSLTTLIDNYTSIGIEVRMCNNLANILHAALVQNAAITLPKNFDVNLLITILSPIVVPAILNSISSIVTNTINDAYDSYAKNFIEELPLDSIDIDKAEEVVQNSIARDAEKKARSFEAYSDSQIKKLQSLKTGFRDTDAFFPSKEYKGIADTNKLAQGDIDGTVVQKKFADRMIGAKLPNGESFSEPVTPFRAKYPYNKVTETLSGHIIEVDDTPHSERIHIRHKSGTYYEIDAEGNMIHRSKGSEYNIVDRNGYLSVHGNYNISVGGDMKIMVCGNAAIEVTGDAVVNCMNDMEMNTAGRMRITAGEDLHIHAPKIYIEADEQLHMVAEEFCRQDFQKLDLIVHEDYVSLVEKNYDMKVNGSTHVETASATHIKSGSDIALNAVGTVSNKAATITSNSTGNINLTASGTLNGRATGNVLLDGAAVYWNSGLSSAVSGLNTVSPVTANEAEYSKAGLIEAREDFVNLPIDDVFPDNFVDEDSYTSDDVQDAATNKTVQDDLIKKGLAKPEDFENVAVSNDTDSGSPVSAIGYVKPDSKLLSLTEAPPDNFMLSPHFSIGMLSSRAPAQANKVKAQQGLSVGQIVYNLAEVALNVCEPIFAIYPNMFVTSGFRLSEESKNSKSAHTMGLAIDMQFKGVSKSEYYNIAKRVKNILNTSDQILLESKSYSSKNSWIHVGFRNSNGEQRNQVATFHNNQKYSDGLVQLS